jgi:hypothetical protein
MHIFKRTILPIFFASLWISISEFARNELLSKSIWVKHYQSLGLSFPSNPINGLIWGFWSILFAIGIYFISRQFALVQTACISWFVGFVLMWVSLYNLSVFPLPTLYFAIPLSFLETFLASLIIIKLSKPS